MKLTQRLLLWLLFFFLCVQILAVFLFGFIDEPGIMLFGLIHTVLVTGYIFIFAIWKKIAAEIRQLKNNEILDEHRKFELEYYELAKQHRQEIATMRHEIANQLQVAASLLRSRAIEDKKKGAALLFDIGQQNSLDDIDYCENTIINTILTVKAKLAKVYDIRMKLDISASENINITKLDLCSVFGNLLDNAIEASKRADKKYIELTVGELSGYFVVKVKNSISTPIVVAEDEFITTKNDNQKHGNGIKLLKRIAEKYDGKINFDYDDDAFTAVLTLKL